MLTSTIPCCRPAVHSLLPPSRNSVSCAVTCDYIALQVSKWGKNAGCLVAQRREEDQDFVNDIILEASVLGRFLFVLESQEENRLTFGTQLEALYQLMAQYSPALINAMPLAVVGERHKAPAFHHTRNFLSAFLILLKSWNGYPPSGFLKQ